jgi:hypothetical protein
VSDASEPLTRGQECPICQNRTFQAVQFDRDDLELHWVMLMCTNCLSLQNPRRAGRPWVQPAARDG